MTSPVEEVVVPLDGSRVAERALDAAAALAERVGADLTVVTCGDAPADDYVGNLRARWQDGPWRAMSLADPLDVVGGMTGDSPQRVLCLSTHGRSGPAGRTLGRTADALIRASRAPTLVIGRSCPAEWVERSGPVIGSVDPERDGHVRRAATRWAEALDRPVELVTVCDPSTGATASPSRPDPSDPSGGGRARLLRSHAVATALIAEAVQLDAVLVVAGSSGRCRGGNEDVLAPLLAGAPCPVLVVPEPDGPAGDRADHPHPEEEPWTTSR